MPESECESPVMLQISCQVSLNLETADNLWSSTRTRHHTEKLRKKTVVVNATKTSMHSTNQTPFDGAFKIACL